MVAKIKKIKKGSRYKEIISSVFLLILFFGIAGFFVFSSWKISKKREEMASRIDSLKKELEMLEGKSESLRSGITDAQTDYYWEEKAREQGYKKPGEEAVVVLPPEDQVQLEPQAPENFWQKVKNFFQSFISK
jgi:cell division protein FtsB